MTYRDNACTPSTLLLCGALVLSSPCVTFGQFADRGDDTVDSIGIFRLVVHPRFQPLLAGYPGFDSASGRLTTPLCFDSQTTIGRSDPHAEGSPVDVGGTSTGTANRIIADSDFSFVPLGFDGAASARREVHLALEQLLLVSGTDECAGRELDPRVPAGTDPVVVRAGAVLSPGEVESQSGDGAPENDFPALGFFNLFVEIDLPAVGGFPPALSGPVTLYNPEALVLTSGEIAAFPPRTVYTVRETMAVELRFQEANPGVWAADDVFGWVVQGGHGVALGCDAEDASLFLDAVFCSQAELPIPARQLVGFGDSWNYFIGTEAPSEPPTVWRTSGFNDSDWEQDAPTAIGYGGSSGKNLKTTLPTSAEDDGNYLTVYFRKTVELSDVDSIGALLLEIDYDDAFVAYMNGVEVARSPNAGESGQELAFDEAAPSSHEHDEDPRIFDLTENVDLLDGGSNLLAVEVHNTSKGSSDLVFSAQLTAPVDRTALSPTDLQCTRRLEGTVISWVNSPGVTYDSITVTRDGEAMPGSPFPGDTDSVVDPDTSAVRHVYAVVASIGDFDCPPLYCCTSEEVTICAIGEEWAYFRGTTEPSPDPATGDPTTAWTELNFDDSLWDVGPSGFGFGDDDDATELDDMRQIEGQQPGYNTLYIRKRFDVPDPQAVVGLALSVDYDDGFVAYLNGEEVARSPTMEDAPGTVHAFDDIADESREAGEPEVFQIPVELRAGGNVIAIQGFNRRITSGDFSLIPELVTNADLTFLCPTEISCTRRIDGTAVSWEPSALLDSVSVTRDGVPVAGSPFSGDTVSVLDPEGTDAPHTYTVVAVIGGRECPPVECTTGDSEIGVIAAGEEWRFFKGTEEPSPDAGTGRPTLGWTRLTFDDSLWETGASGFGYEDDDDATVLEDMQAIEDDPDTPEDESRPGYGTLYIRKVFSIPDPAAILSLALVIDYDDAFVAYINGTEVARSLNTPGNPGSVHAFDQTPGCDPQNQHEAGTPEIFGVDPAGLLASGDNVLAIQGLNCSASSSDFSLIPELVANACFPVQGVTCTADPEAGKVTISWNPSPHQSYVVTRNGVALPGSPFSASQTAAVDSAPGASDAVYEVIGVLRGNPCTPATCTVQCSDVNPGALLCELELADDGLGGLVTQAALSWTLLPPGTASIDVRREGTLVATLRSTATSFTDLNVESKSPESDTEFEVVFRDSDGAALCLLACGPLSLCPEDFTCEVVDGGVRLNWGNIVKEWESFTILRDGAELVSGLSRDTTELLDDTVVILPALPVTYTLRPVAPPDEEVGCDRECVAVLPIPELAKYVAPPGGWDYLIEFEPGEDRYNPNRLETGNLDGSWIRAAEDSWDGSAPLVHGEAPAGEAPGGAGIETLTDLGACGEDTAVLRILDPGNPGSPGSSLSLAFPDPYDEPNNNLILLGRDTGIADRNLLRSGVTISARWRVTPESPDYMDPGPEGDGSPITSGFGQIGIYFFNDGALGGQGAPAGLSFTLDTGDVMELNSLPEQKIGATGITTFRSIWATVEDPEGDDTYDVTFYLNGQDEPFEFFGTATGVTLQQGQADFGRAVGNLLVIGMPSRGNDGDIQIDYVAYKQGIHPPSALNCAECTNNAPVAVIDATPGTTLQLDGGSAQVTLDAGASHDGDGGVQGLTYAWSKQAGPEGDTIVNPTASSATVVFTVPGSYEYILRVDDGELCNNRASAVIEVVVLPEVTEPLFRRGDTDSNSNMEVTDAIRIFSFLFTGELSGFECEDAADADDNGSLEITDGIRILNVLFIGTGVIPAPGFRSCGPDGVEDALDECNYTGSCP